MLTACRCLSSCKLRWLLQLVTNALLAQFTHTHFCAIHVAADLVQLIYSHREDHSSLSYSRSTTNSDFRLSDSMFGLIVTFCVPPAQLVMSFTYKVYSTITSSRCFCDVSIEFTHKCFFSPKALCGCLMNTRYSIDIMDIHETAT